MTIFYIILAIFLAYVIVHSLAELWEDKKDHEFDLTPFGLPDND